VADLLNAKFLNCGSIFFCSEIIRLFRFGWDFPFTGPFLGALAEFGSQQIFAY
jgi:hypothetical protein